MSRHNIDFIAFDFTAEDLDGLALDDPFAELGGHRLGLVGVEIQLLSDLFIGEVQAHEVEAEDPDPQWLVMTGEDGAGEVIEELLTGLASVALACRLGRVMALLGDPPGRAVWTSHPLGPCRSRTVWKHFTSSIRLRMLTIVRVLAILREHALRWWGRNADDSGLYSKSGRQDTTTRNPG